MDFTFSEEQIAARQVARDFARREVYPTLKEWERQPTVEPPACCRAWRSWGLLGLCLPVRYGGQGFDYLTLGWCAKNWSA